MECATSYPNWRSSPDDSNPPDATVSTTMANTAGDTAKGGRSRPAAHCANMASL